MTPDAASPAVAVRPAAARDEAAVLALVAQAGLSIPGVREHLLDFLVAERGGALVGAMGLEHRGADALVRSAVVRESERGHGVGDALFRALVGEARARGVRVLYLLTTRAGGYWARHGFTELPRQTVPARVQESAEFNGACPASAVAMRLELDEAAGAGAA